MEDVKMPKYQTISGDSKRYGTKELSESEKSDQDGAKSDSSSGSSSEDSSSSGSSNNSNDQSDSVTISTVSSVSSSEEVKKSAPQPEKKMYFLIFFRKSTNLGQTKSCVNIEKKSTHNVRNLIQDLITVGMIEAEITDVIGAAVEVEIKRELIGREIVNVIKKGKAAVSKHLKKKAKKWLRKKLC